MANNLMRFDPIRDLSRFDPFDPFSSFSFDEFLSNFNMPPILRNVDAGSLIKLDVSETDDVYYVEAEIPGVRREDIQVEINGNQVSITAEAKREKDFENTSTVRCERFYGQQYRNFSLDQDVDDSASDARYENGVLMLSLPKKRIETLHKKITVN